MRKSTVRRALLGSALAALLWLCWVLVPLVLTPPPPFLSAESFAVFELKHGHWMPYRGDVRASQRVLILTHGVMENTASAFPAAVATSIAKSGGYSKVLGVSYDWSASTTEIAPHYAKFLRSLPARAIDIEAHSYGALQALAGVERAGIIPRNVILLGAPLRGTPFAYDTPITNAALSLPGTYWFGNIGKFQRMRKNGVVADLKPNSSLQRQLLGRLVQLARKHHVHVILVAGSDRFRLSPAANIYFRLFGLECWHCYMPMDGVIPVTSALDDGEPAFADRAVDEYIFATRHARLRNDPDVIKYVAAHLQRD